MKNPLKRIISLILIVAMIASSAQLAMAEISSIPVSSKVPFQISMPFSLGEIVDSYRAARDPRSVVIIQDLHVHAPTQLKIWSLLDYLFQQPSLKNTGLIGVEGAEGPVPTMAEASRPESNLKRQVATFLINKGELTGTEAMAIVTGRGDLVWGIENDEFYQADRSLYVQTMAARQTLQERLDSLQERLLAVSHHVPPSSSIRTVIQDEKALAEGRVMPSEVLLHWLHLGAGTLLAQQPYSRLRALAAVLNTQEKNSQEVAQQAKEFLATLWATLTESEREELARLKTTDPELFYLRLAWTARDHQLENLLPTPLANYLQAIATLHDCDTVHFVEELEAFAPEFKARLAQSSELRNIYLVQHSLVFLKRYLSQQVSDYDVTDWTRHLDSMVARVKQLGILSEMETAALSAEVSHQIDFYSLALARNEPMADNVLAEMERRHTRSGILVAGGFHSSGIADRLRARGVSYVVVTPAIESLPSAIDTALYEDRLADRHTTSEEIMVGAGQASLITTMIAVYIGAQSTTRSRLVHQAFDTVFTHRDSIGKRMPSMTLSMALGLFGLATPALAAKSNISVLPPAFQGLHLLLSSNPIKLGTEMAHLPGLLLLEGTVLPIAVVWLIHGIILNLYRLAHFVVHPPTSWTGFLKQALREGISKVKRRAGVIGFSGIATAVTVLSVGPLSNTPLLKAIYQYQMSPTNIQSIVIVASSILLSSTLLGVISSGFYLIYQSLLWPRVERQNALSKGLWIGLKFLMVGPILMAWGLLGKVYVIAGAPAPQKAIYPMGLTISQYAKAWFINRLRYAFGPQVWPAAVMPYFSSFEDFTRDHLLLTVAAGASLLIGILLHIDKIRHSGRRIQAKDLIQQPDFGAPQNPDVRLLLIKYLGARLNGTAPMIPAKMDSEYWSRWVFTQQGIKKKGWAMYLQGDDPVRESFVKVFAELDARVRHDTDFNPESAIYIGLMVQAVLAYTSSETSSLLSYIDTVQPGNDRQALFRLLAALVSADIQLGDAHDFPELLAALETSNLMPGLMESLSPSRLWATTAAFKVLREQTHPRQPSWEANPREYFAMMFAEYIYRIKDYSGPLMMFDPYEKNWSLNYLLLEGNSVNKKTLPREAPLGARPALKSGHSAIETNTALLGTLAVVTAISGWITGAWPAWDVAAFVSGGVMLIDFSLRWRLGGWMLKGWQTYQKISAEKAQIRRALTHDVQEPGDPSSSTSLTDWVGLGASVRAREQAAAIRRRLLSAA